VFYLTLGRPLFGLHIYPFK